MTSHVPESDLFRLLIGSHPMAEQTSQLQDLLEQKDGNLNNIGGHSSVFVWRSKSWVSLCGKRAPPLIGSGFLGKLLLFP